MKEEVKLFCNKKDFRYSKFFQEVAIRKEDYPCHQSFQKQKQQKVPNNVKQLMKDQKGV